MIKAINVVTIADESVTTACTCTTIYDRTPCDELSTDHLIPLSLCVVDTSLEGHLLVIAEVITKSRDNLRSEATTSLRIVSCLNSDTSMIAERTESLLLCLCSGLNICKRLRHIIPVIGRLAKVYLMTTSDTRLLVLYLTCTLVRPLIVAHHLSVSGSDTAYRHVLTLAVLRSL